jgi:Uma2 family endonuclease
MARRSLRLSTAPLFGELQVSIGIPPSLVPADAVPFAPRRFTVDEYHRMAELGVLTEEDRVELLEGVITPKMVHNPPHDVSISLLENALRSLLPGDWFMRVQSAVSTPDSEPEPDIAIVRGTARDYKLGHPGPADIGLVIEVADSSLARDRKKARLYARAGVPVYWIVNLVDGQLEVFTQPTGPSAAPEYRQAEARRRGDQVSVIIDDAPLGAVRVDDVLP